MYLSPPAIPPELRASIKMKFHRGEGGGVVTEAARLDAFLIIGDQSLTDDNATIHLGYMLEMC